MTDLEAFRAETRAWLEANAEFMANVLGPWLRDGLVGCWESEIWDGWPLYSRRTDRVNANQPSNLYSRRR